MDSSCELRLVSLNYNSLTPNIITSPKFPWTLHPPSTPYIYSLFRTNTIVSRLCSKKNWREPCALNFWHPGCPTYDYYMKKQRFSSNPRTKVRWHRPPASSARAQPCSVQLKLVKRETIHCSKRFESVITVHNQTFGFRDSGVRLLFCCFKWLLKCRLDSCQQKVAVCSFSPRIVVKWRSSKTQFQAF